MLSCEQKQNVIDGKKRIILNPSEGQRRDFETATFAEGDVFGIDILLSTGDDGKVSFGDLAGRIGLHLGLYVRLAWKIHGPLSTSGITQSLINSS
jgi:hypothetical protein